LIRIADAQRYRKLGSNAFFREREATLFAPFEEYPHGSDELVRILGGGDRRAEAGRTMGGAVASQLAFLPALLRAQSEPPGQRVEHGEMTFKA
jgi:hypothetical protein